MNTIIFRTIAPLIIVIMAVFSVYVTLRGHNEPGGGFIGGLIAASSMAIFGMASGVWTVRRALHFDPLSYAGFGVFIAVLSGLASVFAAAPFMTGLWYTLDFGGTEVALSTVLVFDVGVFFVVFGTLTAIALALEDDREDEEH